MRPRTATLGMSIALALITGAACSSFSPSEAPAAADGGLDGVTPDAPMTEDAPPPEEDGTAPPIDADVLAVGFKDLAGIAATETTVYFTERGSGSIHEVPLAGGAPKTFLAASATSIVATDSVVLWADKGKQSLGRRRLGVVEPDGNVTVGGGAPVAIALGSVLGEPRLVVLAKDPGTTSGPVHYFGVDLTVAATTSTTFANPFDVTVFGTDVWWTEPGNGTIWQAPIDDLSAPFVRKTGESGCESIAADGAGIYWTRPSDGLVNMLSLADSTVISLAKTEKQPFGVAADDSGVYWLTRDGKLRRSKPSTEVLPAATVSSGFKVAFDDTHGRPLALTSAYVVWITSDGKVLRHAK